MPALVLALIVVPIVEIAVIVQVGSLIGVLPTIVLLLVESLLGAWIVKREGARAWRSLRAATAAGRLPDRELLDGALVVVGGALLLAPGFVTDLAGFVLVLPVSRPWARMLLLRAVTRRMPVVRVVGRR